MFPTLLPFGGLPNYPTTTYQFVSAQQLQPQLYPYQQQLQPQQPFAVQQQQPFISGHVQSRPCPRPEYKFGKPRHYGNNQSKNRNPRSNGFIPVRRVFRYAGRPSRTTTVYPKRGLSKKVPRQPQQHPKRLWNGSYGGSKYANGKQQSPRSNKCDIPSQNGSPSKPPITAVYRDTTNTSIHGSPEGSTTTTTTDTTSNGTNFNDYHNPIEGLESGEISDLFAHLGRECQ